MNVKNYAGEKITQIMKKTMVWFVSIESSVYHCLLFLDPPLVMSDGVLLWPKAACSRLLVIHCLLQTWLVPTLLPCQLSISTGPRISSLNDPRAMPVLPPPASRPGLWCHQEGGILGRPLGVLFSLQGRWWECLPTPSPHILVCLRLFSIMYCFWWINCPFLVRSQSL